MKPEYYFLGSSTPTAFVTPIDDLLSDSGNTVFILKGTAGSGKSTLMKRISSAFEDSPRELYLCSADPFSLDAVYLKDRKVLIMDGTSPHARDPEYPKAVQSIIDLGAYLEAAPLRSKKEEIIGITDDYSAFHKRCKLCLTAAASVISDIMNAAEGAADINKLKAFSLRTAKRLIPRPENGRPRGKITRKQLSAVTMEGYKTLAPEVPNIYILNDELMFAAAYFIEKTAEAAAAKGYDVIVSRCLIANGQHPEHLIIPELGLAFLTSSCLGKVTADSPKNPVNMKRFYKKGIFRDDPRLSHRMRFGKKAVSIVLKEAAAELTAAKKLHDKLEEYYIAAADFDGLNRLSYKIISEIKSL
ncbi:MAG: ATPase [Oscillospiraceae bacterium]|nr:ATPase [Oscillospiraceae bacterium]